MRLSEVLALHRARILQLANARGASEARVFGSVATGQDREDSDLDLLVDLPVGTSLLAVVDLEQALSDTLGIEVDLCTERALHQALRDRILAEARAL